MIQELIDKANSGDTVTVPAGTYDIDTLNNPIWIKKPLTLNLNTATIKAIPNGSNDRWYFPIGIEDCQDVTLIGGNIVGDRTEHVGTTPAGYGHGVVIHNSHNVRLRSLNVSNCMGDGVIAVGAQTLEIDHVVSANNRRQGFTSSDIDGLWIHDSVFAGTGGAEPGAGIDLEPDLPSQFIKNVRIETSKFYNNAGAGILLACPPGQRSNINFMPSNQFVGKPIDGTDGVVPFYAKWLAQVFGKLPNYPWYYYPRELHI